MFALVMLAISGASYAQVGISITFAPPELPVYEQPPVPGDGYIWTPGYWAYGDDDYYWVPGTWVMPPQAGMLWTPGYWSYGDDRYVFNDGYWGPAVGFYGGGMRDVHVILASEAAVELFQLLCPIIEANPNRCERDLDRAQP